MKKERSSAAIAALKKIMEIEYYSGSLKTADMATCKYTGAGFTGNIYNKGEAIGEYEADDFGEILKTFSNLSINDKFEKNNCIIQERDIYILESDDFSRNEAIAALERGTTVYDAIELTNTLENYLQEWQFEKGEINKIREMVQSHGKTWADGWSVVSVNHKYYYICEVN